MGASDFRTEAEGRTAQEAFDAAVSSAQWEHGHGGYSGTVAEKSDFVVVSDGPMSEEDGNALADRLASAGDPRVGDKWGPAGMVELHGGKWVVFGVAPC